MKLIPTDIEEIIDKKKPYPSLLYQDENFILVIDPKHKQKDYHYTSWHKRDIRSLLELNKKDVSPIKNLIDNIKKLDLFPKDCKIYIHYPPNFWRLHIHFVSPEYFNKHKVLDSETYLVENVIKNLEKDENYYRKNVKIRSKL